MNGLLLESMGVNADHKVLQAFASVIAQEARRQTVPTDLSVAKKLIESTELSDPDAGAKLYTQLSTSSGIDPRTLSGWLEKQDPSDYDADGRVIGLDAFDRCMAVKFADWGGLDRVCVRDFAEGPGMVLMPEYIRRQFMKGQQMHGMVGDLIARTVTETRSTYEPLWVSYPKTRAGDVDRVDEGGAMRVISIRRREKSVKMRSYGVVLNVAYNVLRDTALPEFQVVLWFLGFNNEEDKVEQIYTAIYAGDGTAPAASQVTSGTSGTLVYSDLVALHLEFHPFVMNAMITSKVWQKHIINLSEFKDPEAGFVFQRTGELMSPLGAKMYRNDGGTAAINNRYLVGLDKRFAVIEARDGALLIEGDKIIERKTEEAAISEEIAYAKLLDNASYVLDMQAALT